jgi:hypothetical protein
MYKTIIFFLLIFPTSAMSQDDQSKVDSFKYYQRELSKIVRAHRQQLQQDSHYSSLVENLKRVQARRDNYRGFILYAQLAAADFNKLNSDINTAGFPALSGHLWGVGYGFTSKKNRRVFDLNIGAFGIDKESKKEGENVNTTFGTYFEFTWGYDFIKSRMVNIYPYLGFGLRSTTLEYDAKTHVDPTASSITNIVQNNRSVLGTITEIGYLAGGAFEFVVTNSTRPGGTIVFVKAGTNRAFSSKQFNLEGKKYDAELNPGSYMIYTGFKFFFR